MIPRRLESRIIEALQRSPSVALMGPRQVGNSPASHLPGAYMCVTVAGIEPHKPGAGKIPGDYPALYELSLNQYCVSLLSMLFPESSIDHP